MTALRANTARLLLDRVSQDDRAQVVEQVAKSLDATSEAADVGFAATLLHLHPSENAKSVILAHLKKLVERGDHGLASAVCQDHPELRSDVFAAIAWSLHDTAIRLGAYGQKWIAVPASKNEKKAANGADDESDSLAKAIEESTEILQFMARIGSTQKDGLDTRTLLDACMVLVGASDKRLSAEAQEVLYSVLLTAESSSAVDRGELWARIQSLIGSPDNFYKTVGFSLWLRWSVSANAPGPAILKQDVYWALLVDGLARGDGERRKLALQILRSSVQVAVQDPSLTSTIASASAHDQAPAVIQNQYDRFCTVFEAIVFGRYLNQVLECEADLDFLSSTRSAVKPVWLYTLLTSALDQRFQDSNRKFIGTWIMRSNPRTDDIEGYLTFFRTAFLPWVTGGSMFTSTLRRQGDSLRCEHGETLATYICQLLQSNSDIAAGIIDSILDSIIGRHGNNFAYAVVHLVDGIGKACDADSSLTLSDEQLEKLARIATWAGLPEIARDYILARAWKLCHDHVQSDATSSHSELVVTTAQHWEKLQHWVQNLRPSASAHVDGNIASLALEPSRREKYEQKAIDKCVALVKGLQQHDPNSSPPEQYEASIDDIFGDLDYLEYPKSFCVMLPTVVPNRALVDAASKSTSKDVGDLAEVVSAKVMDIVGLTEVRSYMLQPFASSLRDVVLRVPSAVSVVPIEEVIMRLSEHPPSPTPDAQLEDATIPVLQSLAPELARLDYEFYFSPRESNGFAAFLDIASRIGSVDASINQQIFDRILQRWATQKTPPPTVSVWKTALQLQVMLLCLEQRLPLASADERAKTLNDLHHILAIEPLPRYRYLLEWMIARIYLHAPELKSKIFEELGTKDHHSNPKFLASLMKLGVMMAKTESSDEAFAKDLAAIFVPLAASSKVVIRHEAQWQIPVLMDHARHQGWASIVEDSAFNALDDFIRSLERFGDPPLERQIDKLDPVKDHNLTHLVEGRWWDLDTVEHCQASREDFVRLYAADEAENTPLPKACMSLGDARPAVLVKEVDTVATAINQRKILQNIDNISRALGSGPVTVPTAASTALQTKGAAYLESSRSRFTNLLVVASLVDNPYNLGGLSRVSEIFGAGGMYLTNPNVTSNKDFTGVSVSSHLHFPIQALSAEGIPEFLAKKKREDGFKVVGIEQTDRSVILGSKECVLPEKCILVMGSEREGIPALVLSECDVLVEIRQVGVTRSLNVQTACGIVLSEWMRQHG
ncbi:hypothetical protein PRZ48_003686 [Zasmidium cellare]|uniref:tRNA/rRNA methyltransferase SpoU type domain-containing protein n=1 Tax=Zasmidium cellare TaxID=395010 RepID=A0ABR0EX17_ZASCE|nr:hypothetical protein PRZ48_003686 [Zasmidium cellare]